MEQAHTYNDGLVDLAGRDVVVTSQLDVEIPEDVSNTAPRVEAKGMPYRS